MKKLICRILFLNLLVFCSGYSQDGSLDISFGNDGIVVTDFYGFSDISLAIAQQSDNKLITAGYIETEYDNYLRALVRYNPDGSIDNSFGVNGEVLIDLGDGFSYYHSLFALDSGKIIACGSYGNWGDKDFLISKFNEDGSVDTSFGNNGHLTIDFLNEDDLPLEMIIQEDGKILILGRSKQGSEYWISIARFYPTGDPDTSFGSNGKLILDYNEDYVSDISASVQSDNSIVISFSEPTGNSQINAFRLHENGDLDTSFGMDGFLELQFNSLYVYSISKIDFNDNLLILYTLDTGSGYYETSISRYDSNGSLDSSFGNGGISDIDISFIPYNIILQQNSRILVGGGIPEFEGSYFTMRRLHYDGSIDYSFLSGFGYFESSDFILQNDGKIVATGNTYWYDGDEDFVLVRYNNNPLGFSEFNIKSLEAYPNPSIDIFNITTNRLHDTAIEFQVTDLTGKLIQKGVLEEITTKLDLSAYQNGMYFFNAGWITLKLIKE